MITKVNGKRVAATLAVLLLVAALYGGFLLLRNADVTASKQSLLHPAGGSRLFMSMEGFRFTRSENGRVAWQMYARNADLFENKEAQLKDLEITFTAPDRRVTALIGESGTMDTSTGDASIKGIDRDVRVVTSDGYLLTTRSLFWNAGERLVDIRDQFKVLGKEIYFEGKGLSANVDMRSLVVNSNVKAVLQE